MPVNKHACTHTQSFGVLGELVQFLLESSWVEKCFQLIPGLVGSPIPTDSEFLTSLLLLFCFIFCDQFVVYVVIHFVQMLHILFVLYFVLFTVYFCFLLLNMK